MKAVGLFATQLLTYPSTDVDEIVPVKILTRDGTATPPDTPYFALAIKFDTGATSIILIAIDLAVADILQVSDDNRPLMFQYPGEHSAHTACI